MLPATNSAVPPSHPPIVPQPGDGRPVPECSAPPLDEVTTLIPLVTGASGAVVLDGDGRVMAVSASAARGAAAGTTGAGERAVGTQYLSLCEAAAAAGSECARTVARALGEVLAGRRDELRVEYRCRVAGADRWWSTRIARLEGGGSACVLVAHEDVTERRATECALRRSEERHELVSRATNDVIWDWDLRTGALSWNDAVFHAFGYPTTEPVSVIDWWREHLHPDDRERVVTGLDAVIAAGEQMWSDEYRYRRGDGSYAVVVDRGYVSRDDGGVPVRMIGSMLDITERKRSDEEMRQAQKMEAVGRLAGGVAHDFNNLLAAIRINCELLLEELGPAHPGRGDAAEIRHAAARAASLTRQLLAFSRKQVMQPRVLDLNSVVAGVEQMLRRIIGEDVALDTSLDPALGCVRADPGQLEQVLVNLAVNARDAMPVGGRLTIGTAGATLDRDAARQHGVAPGRYAVLAVSDTGLGMDEATRARIFEPFFTTKDPGKGTGLGLATVYGIVRQSGGFVQVTSGLGRGSTFRIHLPWVTEAAEGDGASPACGALPRGTETVLVAEDEDAVRASVVRVLRRCGYTTVEARNGLEALRACRGLAGAIDLVVTDIVMPEMGGYELAERLAADRPGTPVLFMSGYTDGDLDRHGALAAGAVFMGKPFTMSALATSVREAIDGARR